MGKRFFERWVDDRLIPVEVDRDELLAVGADLRHEAGDVAASIGLVGELIGDYSRQLAVADAAYRHWRAQTFLAAKTTGEGRAPSDETAKTMVDADPAFLSHKATLAELGADLEYLRGIFDALRAKASLIRARVDLDRGKQDGEGVGMDLRPRSDDKADRARAVRAAMGRE